jgi:tetratricopeptide (TPR) repeat protein
MLALQLPSTESVPAAMEADEARREAIERMNAGVEHSRRFNRYEAELAMQAAIERDPTYWRPHVNLGRLLLDNIWSDDAERELTIALKLLEAEADDTLAVSRAEIYDDLGRLYLAQARDHENNGDRVEHIAALRRAAAVFDEAIRTEHIDHRTLHDRAVVLDGLDHPVEADRSYRACIELRPDYGPCYADLARMVYDYGLDNLAFAILDTATHNVATGAEPWFAYAELCVKVGEPKRAIKAALQAQLIDPELTDVLFPLALAYADLGMLDEAVQTFLDYMEHGRADRFYDRKVVANEVAERLLDAK